MNLPSRTQRRITRRAYALVMAVLISAMMAVVLTIMVSRQSAQTYAHVRALDRYQDHHLRKGLQEVLTAWLRGYSNRSLADLVDENGKAMEIDAGERVFIVHLSDGQGAALDGPVAGLTPLEEEVLDRLLSLLDGMRSETPLTRTSGPPAISLASAPEPVLTAAIRAISPGTPPETFVGAIMAARARGLTSIDLDQAANAANIPPERRPLLYRFFTFSPQLWRVDVEERLTQGPERELLVARHRGLIDMSPRTGTLRDRLTAGLEGGNLISEWTREAIEPGHAPGGVRLQRPDGRTP
jgi:hypothetical protein